MRKNAVFHMLYTAQNAVFPLILSVYLARVLGAEGVGQVAYGKNLVSYFTMATALGLPVYAQRELGRRTEKHRLFSELAVLGFFLGAVCACLCGAVLLWRHPGDGVLWVLWLETVLQAGNVEWLYPGMEDFGFPALRSAVEKVVTLGLVLFFVRGRENVDTYCRIYVLGKGLGVVWSLVRAGRYVSFTWKGLDVGRHWRPVAVLLAGTLAAGLYSRVDISMLGLLASAESVGYYANAHKVVNIGVALCTAVSAVSLPRLSREFGGAGYEAAVSEGLEAALTLAVPGCLGLWLVSEDVTVCLFGAEFLPGAAVLRILSVLVLLKGLGDMVCYQVLVSAGQEKWVARAYLAAAAGNVGLNGLLIPVFSHVGAAVASVLAESVVMLVLVPKARKFVRPRVSRRFVTGVLLGTAGMLAAVLAVQSVVRMGMLRLVLSVGAGAVVYFAAVAAVFGGREKHGAGNLH